MLASAGSRATKSDTEGPLHAAHDTFTHSPLVPNIDVFTLTDGVQLAVDVSGAVAGGRLHWGPALVDWTERRWVGRSTCSSTAASETGRISPARLPRTDARSR